jgi:hypothetical protein
LQSNANAQAMAKHPLSLYNKNVLQGQGGLKFTAGSRFKRHHFVELGYFRSDIPKYKDLTEKDWTLGNQQIYGAVEFSKIGNDVYLAPKIGYEYAAFIFTARINWANYINTSYAKNDSRIVLEPGITFAGFGSLFYGFLIPVGGTYNPKIGRNSLTFTFNYFDMFRPKHTPPKK